MPAVFKYYLTVLLLSLAGATAFAQTEQKTDSILKAAKLDIYEKPDSVIKIADSVFNSKSSSAKIKAQAQMLISNAYSAKRDYRKALKILLGANKLAKNSGDISTQAKILNGIGVVYQQLKMYDKAMESLDECDRLIDNNEFEDATFLRATNHAVRGFIYKEQLSCDLAISFFDKAINEYKKLNSLREQPNLSITSYNKGYCCLVIPDYDKAIQSFNEAVAYAENANAVSLKAFAKKGLAEVYTRQGNYKGAIQMLEEAYDLSKDAGDLILLRTIYEGLANNYLALNDKDKYLFYHKLFLRNQAVIKKSERSAVSDSIDELTHKNAEKLDALIRRYYSLTAILILLIIFAVIVIFRYQKRAVKSLEMLKNQVETVKKERRNSY